MKIMQSRVAGLTLVSCCLMLTACAPFPSRPTPGETYDEVCHYLGDDKTNMPANRANAAVDGTAASGYDRRVPGDPNWYEPASAAQDIAIARMYVNDKRMAFQRFECRKELSNRIYYDRPLLVTAIVAGAAALAKANAYIIGGVGLTAGALATFKTYNHPDSDRDAFLTAYGQLTCVYDETHSLALTAASDKAIYNRDALQLAIESVGADVGPLSVADAKLTPGQKATLAAANTALDAGNKALEAANASIANYGRISTTIYKTTTAIDMAARNVNKTNGNYSAFTSEIKAAYTAAGQAQSTTQQAKQQVAAADAAQKSTETANAGTAAPAKNTPPQIIKALQALESGSTELTQQISNLKFNSSCTIAAPKSLCPDVQASAKGATNQSVGKPIQAAAIGTSTTTGDVSKLVRLAAIVTEDLPVPAYSEILGNVSACAAK